MIATLPTTAAFTDAFNDDNINTLFPENPGYVPPVPSPAAMVNNMLIRGNDPAVKLGQQF